MRELWLVLMMMLRGLLSVLQPTGWYILDAIVRPNSLKASRVRSDLGIRVVMEVPPVSGSAPPRPG